MFILKNNSVWDERICSLDADVDRFRDFPTFEEDTEALTQHDQPGGILGLIKEILAVSHEIHIASTRKIMDCLKLA